LKGVVYLLLFLVLVGVVSATLPTESIISYMSFDSADDVPFWCVAPFMCGVGI